MGRSRLTDLGVCSGRPGAAVMAAGVFILGRRPGQQLPPRRRATCQVVLMLGALEGAGACWLLGSWALAYACSRCGGYGKDVIQVTCHGRSADVLQGRVGGVFGTWHARARTLAYAAGVGVMPGSWWRIWDVACTLAYAVTAAGRRRGHAGQLGFFRTCVSLRVSTATCRCRIAMMLLGGG